MTCYVPGCLGSYDFDHIAEFARKRYVDGCETVELLAQASCEREKEEIALVSMLDLADHQIRDLQLTCRHSESCKIVDCRQRLKRMIESELIRVAKAG